MTGNNLDPFKPMAERYRRPDWVRRINAMGDAVGGSLDGARRLVPIDSAELQATARESLDGDSFGDFGDPDWTARFAALAMAADSAPFHTVGRLITRQELFRALRTRLLLGRALEANPGIEDEPVSAPLIVTGPARSGTSILYELLALDPSLRAPMAYEALHPVAPGERAASNPDPRIAMAECEQEFWADVQPEFAAIHELRSDLPVECVTLTAPSFCGPHWGMVLPAGAPMDPPTDYAFHRRILQSLQHPERPTPGSAGPNWLLKTPAHLAMLPFVFQTYPDAWIVQTHRDPTKTMPSTASTTAMVRWIRSDQVDIATLAVSIDAAFSGILNAVATQRDSGELPKRFVDVHFQDLLADPVDTVRRAYAGMGCEFTPAHAEEIQSYLAHKPRGKFGVHRYEAEDWGFNPAELRERMRPYIDHFGIALEDS